MGIGISQPSGFSARESKGRGRGSAAIPPLFLLWYMCNDSGTHKTITHKIEHLFGFHMCNGLGC
jgi:hypothetical protein